jgi:hypothetical protein
VLDKNTYDVIPDGASVAPFDASMFHLRGRTQLG